MIDSSAFEDYKETIARLDSAETEQEVVEIAQYYLSGVSPKQWASLPEQCWPQRLRRREDLAVMTLMYSRQRAFSWHAIADVGLVDRILSVLAHANLCAGLIANGFGQRFTAQALLEEIET